MVSCINACRPSILCGGMVLRRPRLALFCIQILSVRASRHGIVVLEEISLAKFRDEKFNDVLEGSGFYGVGEVEAVHISQ